MRKLLFIFIGLLLINTAHGQAPKKYAIGKSGCSAYFVCDPGKFVDEKSPDSADVYTGECTSGDFSYGMICVKLKNRIKELPASEEVLMRYLDYLKTSFKITSAAGYEKGLRLKNKENTRGIADYWTDGENGHWRVKGWTDGRFIAVMYVYAKADIPKAKADTFLNSFLFAGM